MNITLQTRTDSYIVTYNIEKQQQVNRVAKEEENRVVAVTLTLCEICELYNGSSLATIQSEFKILAH